MYWFGTVTGMKLGTSGCHQGTCANFPVYSPEAMKTARSYGVCAASSARSSPLS